MEENMDVDGDCFSVAQTNVAYNVEVKTENGYPPPPSPAVSMISESDASVTSERGKGEPLDLNQVINDSFKDIGKIPMRKLRKACPELHRRCYQTKKGKRKVKFSWDPLNKPHDWPSHIRFVDPNNGVKGKDGRYTGKPGRKDLDLMFVFLRDKYLGMSTPEHKAEPVMVKRQEQLEVKKEKQEAVASDFGKRMPREESAPAPKPTVDMRKIMERRDVTLDKLRHQVKSYPKVQGQLDRIKTELCAQYNRLCGRDQDMHSYMKFITNCSQIEVLTDNMDTLGPAFVETYFDAQSQKTLDGLRDSERPGSGGFRQETVSYQAIQVHGVESSDDATTPHGVATHNHNHFHVVPCQHLHTTSGYTEAPPSGGKGEFDEKKCVPDMLEKSTAFEKEEKTVGFCFGPELNVPIDWNAKLKKEVPWLDQVVADDELKFLPTEEELFNTMQIELRKLGPEEKAEEGKKLEEMNLERNMCEQFKLEVPPTNLDRKSESHDDQMEGVEDGVSYNEKNDFVDLQPPTELARYASVGLEASLEASLNHTGVGDQSPIAIHAPFALEVMQDLAAGGYPQQDYVGGEIPSCVEEFNEHDSDEMMEDAVPTQMYPSLDESFSHLSGFSSLDIDKDWH